MHCKYFCDKICYSCTVRNFKFSKMSIHTPSAPQKCIKQSVTPPVYNRLIERTFTKLINYFDGIIDREKDTIKEKEIDLNISSGSISYKNILGEYIFSRQTAAKELWLSSPFSGPWKFEIKECKPIKNIDLTNSNAEIENLEFRARSGLVQGKEIFDLIYEEIQ